MNLHPHPTPIPHKKTENSQQCEWGFPPWVLLVRAITHQFSVYLPPCSGVDESATQSHLELRDHLYIEWSPGGVLSGCPAPDQCVLTRFQSSSLLGICKGGGLLAISVKRTVESAWVGSSAHPLVCKFLCSLCHRLCHLLHVAPPTSARTWFCFPAGVLILEKGPPSLSSPWATCAVGSDNTQLCSLIPVGQMLEAQAIQSNTFYSNVTLFLSSSSFFAYFCSSFPLLFI